MLSMCNSNHINKTFHFYWSFIAIIIRCSQNCNTFQCSPITQWSEEKNELSISGEKKYWYRFIRPRITNESKRFRCIGCSNHTALSILKWISGSQWYMCFMCHEWWYHQFHDNVFFIALRPSHLIKEKMLRAQHLNGTSPGKWKIVLSFG